MKPAKKAGRTARQRSGGVSTRSAAARPSRRPKEPVVARTAAELRQALDRPRGDSKRVGLVPTMGALHQGHLGLVELACGECEVCVVSVFVNPTQFNNPDDLKRYPRNLAADLKVLGKYPVDVVFAPDAGSMYPAGWSTWVDVGKVTVPFEGQFRPGHFRGVATVVLKLFNLVRPDVAWFGQKDYQQLLVIRRMAADLDLPIEVRMGKTVREPDGLAMSSRNVHLSESERGQAAVLSRSLFKAQAMVQSGERDVGNLLTRMNSLVSMESGVRLDYLAIADAETLAPVDRIDRRAVALVAAHVGRTRLIDNVLLELPG